MKTKSHSVYWIDAYDASMTFVKDKNGDVNSLRYRWINSAKKIIPLQVDITQFSSYTGEYYSAELSTEYKVDVIDNKLMIHHMRLGDFDFTRPDSG